VTAVAISGLEGIRVVDLSTGVTGPYCTKLFADAGAEVIKVEPAEGDPMRRWSATGVELGERDGALFQYLHTSKRSVVGEPGDRTILDLIAGADLLVESYVPERLDIDALRERSGQLVVLSVSPYGRTGPYAERPATEFVIQAESGSIASRGRVDEPPIHGGGRVVDWTAGSYAAPPALAAVLAARRTGVGVHIDLSVAECGAIAMSTFRDLAQSMLGGSDTPMGIARCVETPSIEPASDGWVGFNTNTGEQFQNFLVMIERFDLIETGEWNSAGTRMSRLDEWNEIVHAWTTRHPVDEIVRRASDLRIPVAQVCDGEAVLDHEHFAARGTFVENAGGFRQPRPPYQLEGSAGVRAFEPAPALGEANAALAPRKPPAPEHPEGEPALPLAGLRILDMTSWWAGPSCTHALASLGAEAIHVESTGHPDGMRLTGFMFGKEDWWEWGHMFVAANTNKLGVTLDMKSELGLDLVRRLVAECDVVIENFSPRVADKFDLTWDHIHEINPEAVFVRMPAFGLSGPWRERVGFAQTMEQLTGMAWLTGHEFDQPRIMRGPCDPIAGMHAAFATLVALAERERSGKGLLVEAPMVESALNCAAEQIVEFSAYGGHMARAGNRGPYAAPQGIYECLGTDRWLALAVENDQQWHALVGVFAASGVGLDGSLQGLASRRAAHDDIDAAISGWARERTVEEAVAELIAAGVPAGDCRDPRLLNQHPQFVARGFYEELRHPVVGTHMMPGLPYRYSGVDAWNREASPTLGQHNHAVLQGILGLTDQDVESLEAKGVIGTRPAKV
jgi:crotonobetainyl-CoA:carnitine CoA-transferase CaiB-like acyl-CoA transferase